MSSISTPLYKRVLFRIAIVIFTLYSLIWLLSSPIIKHFAKKPLAEYGLILSNDASISFNPFLTRINISNLALTKDNEPVFTTKHLALQLALYKVPFDIIQLEELSIEGVNIKVEKHNNDLIVAGINLTPKNTEPKAETKETENTNEQSQPSSYEVRLAELALSNTVIDVTFEGAPHKFDIKKLLISNIKASQTHQSATLKLTSLLDGAAINLSSELNLDNNKGSINNQLDVSNYSLTHIKHFIEPLSLLAGTFSFSTNPYITLTNNGLSVTASNTQLKTNNTQANTKEQSIHLESLTYKMKDFAVSLEQNNIQEIIGTSQLSLNNALVELLSSETLENGEAQENKKAQKILSFSQLNINNIIPKIDVSSDTTTTPSILIESIELNDFLFSQNTYAELPPVATINNISINNIVGSANALSIDTINVDSITSHVILNKEKVLANLVNLSSQEKPSSEQSNSAPIEETKPVEQEDAEVEQAFHINLNTFNVINQNQIDFIDNSVNPAYKRTFIIDKLSIGKLSNLDENKEEKTPIELTGRSNEYANFAFNGFIKPFAQQKTYHIKGDLNELSLPAVSTYMKDALELELASGQLNTQLDVTLIDDDIDGDVNISINGLETSAVNNHETANIKGQVAIPFNVALDMLKDSDGNLVLDVPLSGKTSDPSFGIGSFIALITKKAAMSATKDYIMTTFVPYANIVSVAMTAGEFILKVRFEISLTNLSK